MFSKDNLYTPLLLGSDHSLQPVSILRLFTREHSNVLHSEVKTDSFLIPGLYSDSLGTLDQ